MPGDQTKRLRKPKVAVALQDELGRVPTEKEITIATMTDLAERGVGFKSLTESDERGQAHRGW